MRILGNRWLLLQVDGVSMRPALRPGQMILVDCRRRPHVGDMVIAKDPRNGEPIVKWLTQIEDGYWLEGDAMQARTAESSADSWVFGPVQAIDAVVIWPRRRRSV